MAQQRPASAGVLLHPPQTLLLRPAATRRGLLLRRRVTLAQALHPRNGSGGSTPGRWTVPTSLLRADFATREV